MYFLPPLDGLGRPVIGGTVARHRARITVIALTCAPPLLTHEGPQSMPKAPEPRRKNIPIPIGTLSKYFPVDSIPSRDVIRGPPALDPVREVEAERWFLSHNDEGGFQTFANLYTMVYLAKPKLVQGHPPPPSQAIDN